MIKNNLIKIWGVITLLFLLASSNFLVANANKFDPLEYLRKNYPKLTQEYENELLNFPVHYIFAVDVSGTMIKYSAQVDSALVPFIEALPDNDYVTFIRFGTTAKDNEAGYNTCISANSKISLINNIHSLYNNTNDNAGDFRKHTDIYKAIKAISDVEKRRQEAKQNVVIIITDFRNEDGTGNEKKFDESQLESMQKMIESANIGKESRNIALKLQVDENKPGYCLPQLQTSVFPSEGKAALQIVPVGNDRTTINSWFEQLRRDIMVTKLKSIIDIENRAIDITFDKTVSIDGDVATHIKWKPTRLYKKMRIDSSIVAEPNKTGFSFDVNNDELGEKKDLEFDAELGQLKHSGFGLCGFYHMQDSLQLGVDMPTDFDQELQKLDVQKPISAPKQYIDKWIFTLPIPFWLACVIVAIIVIYILLVIRQIKINASNAGCFKGEIVIKYNDESQDPQKSRLTTYQKIVTVGKNGSGKTKVQGAGWSFSMKKVTFSPFRPFHNPEIHCVVESGYVANQSNKKEMNGREIKGMMTFICGSKRTDLTHKVNIRIC